MTDPINAASKGLMERANSDKSFGCVAVVLNERLLVSSVRKVFLPHTLSQFIMAK